jgi:hypothetical protein
MDNKITALQARQIAERNSANNAIVKLNIDYILEKIIKEANKGELHTYISTNELNGDDFAIQKTFTELGKLGYIAVNADFDNNSKLYKVTW